MENVLSLIFSEDNIRMLVLLVFGYCGYLKLSGRFDRRIDHVEYSLKTEIKDVRTELKAEINDVRAELKAEINDVRAELKAEINELKTNDITDLESSLRGEIVHLGSDIAHLSGSFDALTYALEKNRLLEEEDKAYLGSRRRRTAVATV